MRLQPGRARPQSHRRSAGEHRDRRPEATDSDPLANSPHHHRRTRGTPPTGDELAAARQAHLDAVPAAKYYVDYSDFTLWVLRVERVRWVGGYGRMDSATRADYTAAEPDPVQAVPPQAPSSTSTPTMPTRSPRWRAHFLGGYPDTITATCTGVDRYGLDLRLDTERGIAYTRVGYAAPIDSYDQLRSATVELARRARGA